MCIRDSDGIVYLLRVSPKNAWGFSGSANMITVGQTKTKAQAVAAGKAWNKEKLDGKADSLHPYRINGAQKDYLQKRQNAWRGDELIARGKVIGKDGSVLKRYRFTGMYPRDAGEKIRDLALKEFNKNEIKDVLYHTPPFNRGYSSVFEL